ncbi:hypothetical protein C8J56DRAFT_901638 [Mycena floridula]|nr:hypothetical protein C8J56DRAFT_901638 [Mycena floridula]
MSSDDDVDVYQQHHNFPNMSSSPMGPIHFHQQSQLCRDPVIDPSLQQSSYSRPTPGSSKNHENAMNRGIKRSYDKLLEVISARGDETVSIAASATNPSLVVPDLPVLNMNDPKYHDTLFLWYQGPWLAMLQSAKKETNISGPVLDGDATVSLSSPNIPAPPNSFSPLAPGNSKGKSRAAQDINVMMRFIIDIDGNIIGGRRATEIHDHLYTCLQELVNLGAAPVSWKQASLSAKKFMNYHMATKFPELQYCAENWKTQRLLTNLYSSFCQNLNLNSTGERRTKRQRKTTHASSSGPLASQSTLDQETTPPEKVVQPVQDKAPEGSENVLPSNEQQAGPPEGLENVTPYDKEQAGPPEGSESVIPSDEQQAGPPEGLENVIPAEQPANQHPPNGLHADILKMMNRNPLYEGVTPMHHKEDARDEGGVQQHGERVSKTYKNPDALMKAPKDPKTARALCAQDWVIQHPRGTKKEFDLYFTNLQATDPVSYQRWKTAAEPFKVPRKQTKKD